MNLAADARRDVARSNCCRGQSARAWCRWPIGQTKPRQRRDSRADRDSQEQTEMVDLAGDGSAALNSNLCIFCTSCPSPAAPEHLASDPYPETAGADGFELSWPRRRSTRCARGLNCQRDSWQLVSRPGLVSETRVSGTGPIADAACGRAVRDQDGTGVCRCSRGQVRLESDAMACGQSWSKAHRAGLLRLCSRIFSTDSSLRTTCSS